jgi:hypothetical protein
VDYVGADKRGNPYRDIKITVTFTNCDHPTTRIQSYGFWYGLEKKPDGTYGSNSKIFRIRGQFPAGNWQWSTTCSGTTNALGANKPLPDCSTGTVFPQKIGKFQVTANGSNALYRSGALSISEDKRYLTYTKTYVPTGGAVQKIPFFWMGDTAWNAPIAATLADWKSYIDDRSQELPGRPGTAFTVVQIGLSPKSAGLTDINSNPPFDLPNDPTCTPDASQAPSQCSSWNPQYWKGLDDKIQYANQKGVVVFLAGLMEPLQKDLSALSQADAETAATTPVPFSAGLSTLARNAAARYSGNFVVLSPGFDHQIQPNFNLINTIGTTLSDNATSSNLVANHPAGQSSPVELQSLQAKPWMDFQMYQSGSPGDTPDAELYNEIYRVTSLAVSLSTYPKPVINGEAAYDGPGPNLVNHTPYRARQTACLSFLSGATGYTAGTCGIYDWGRATGGCTSGWTWQVGRDRQTSRTMRYLRSTLQTVNWQRLRPDSNRVLDQATVSVDKKSVLAYDGSSAIVAYLPAEPLTIKIDFKANGNLYRAITPLSTLTSTSAFLQSGWVYRWFSPRTGKQLSTTADLTYVSTGVFLFTKPKACDHDAPDTCSLADNDWILRITKTGGIQPPPPGLVASHLEVSNEISSASGVSTIVVQRVDEATGAPLSYLELGGQGTKVLGAPQLAIEPGGNTLIAWQSDDETGSALIGRFLDAQGNPLTAEIPLNTEATMAPEHPAVAVLDTGGFVVTWRGPDGNGDGPWIWYRLFDSTGNALGPEQLVMGCDLISGDYPQVTATSLGAFGVAWEMAGGTGIHYVEIGGDGNPTGQEGTLAQGSSGWPVLESIDGSTGDLSLAYSVYSADASQTPTVTGAKVQAAPAPASPSICP